MTGKHAAPTTRHTHRPTTCRIGAHQPSYPNTLQCDRCGHTPILWAQARIAAEQILEDARRHARRIRWGDALFYGTILGFAFFGVACFTAHVIRILGAA